jgi:hypothetical protein
MLRTAGLAALAATLTLAGAFAAEPAADPAKGQRICRAPAKQLGSRIRTQRRCRTAEQWQEEDAKGGLPIGAQVTQGQNDGHAVQQPK